MKAFSRSTRAFHVRQVYANTHEFNSQRWLMLTVEDRDAVYADALRLIEIRSQK